MKFKMSFATLITLLLSVLLLLQAAPVYADNVDIPQTLITKAVKAFTKNGTYEYAPTIMKDGNVYKMWFCGNSGAEGLIDRIFYTTSGDLVHWSTPSIVLGPASPPQGMHACDPTVVRANNGTFFMYYTSDSGAGGRGNNNQVYLAKSSDGIHWNYANSKNAVIPLNVATRNPTAYGIGMSSVLIKDNQFIQSYLNSYNSNSISVAGSTNGINFQTIKGNAGIGGLSVDIKYMPGRQQYIAVYGSYSLSLAILSKDFVVQKRLLIPSTAYPFPCDHNAGLLGDNKGNLLNENEATIFFSSGPRTSGGDCFNPGVWDIWKMTVNLAGMLGNAPSTTANVAISSPKADDVNLDGIVNYTDYQRLISSWGSTGGSSDINHDGTVNIFDYGLFITNYGK